MAVAKLFIDSLTKWNITELKDELRRHNLSPTGGKASLVQRLQEFYEMTLTSTSEVVQQSNPLVSDTMASYSSPERPAFNVSTNTHEITTRSSSFPVNRLTEASVSTSNPFLDMMNNSSATSNAIPDVRLMQPQQSSGMCNSSLLKDTYRPPLPVSNTALVNQSYESPRHNQTNPFLPDYQPIVSMNSTSIRDQEPPTHSYAAPTDQLSSLEHELKVLRAKDEIRTIQHRLSLPPEELRASEISTSHSLFNTEVGSMLSLVKKSVDISGLPPAKPIVFSGNAMEYRQWKSSFNLLIEEKDLSPAQKFSYLQTYLSGKALRCIQGYVMFNTSDAYKEAIKMLDDRFGDPFDLADAFRDKLEKWPKIGNSDDEGLREYADFVKQCRLAMNEITELDKLNDSRELKRFVNCLPTHLITRWSRESGTNKIHHKRNPVFSEYADFVMKEALLACDKTTSFSALTSKHESTYGKGSYNIKFPTERNTTVKSAAVSTDNHDGKNAAAYTSSTNVAVPSQYGTNLPNNSTSKYCHQCKTTGSHATTDCRQIARMTINEQRLFCEREGLCFQCFKELHAEVECIIYKCGYQGCKEIHPACTHRYRASYRLREAKNKFAAKPDQCTSCNSDSVVKNTSDSAIGHKLTSANIDVVANSPVIKHALTTMIVPVYISSTEQPNHEFLTYALLDSGSDNSFITKQVCSKLFVSKLRRRVKVSTITSVERIQWCNKISNLRVRGFSSLDSQTISIPEVYVQESIPVNREHIPTPETALQWEHLKSIHDKLAPMQQCEVGLIIGYNCSAASLPLQTVRNSKDVTLPYAIQTILGWSITGGNCFGDHVVAHRILINEETKEEILTRLEEDLSVTNDELHMSQNDLTFLKKMETSTTITDGFYTMPLPFKSPPCLPDNRQYALKRFQNLHSRLNANPILKEKYVEFMDEIITNGEAQVVTELDTEGWYIPHHGVFHPKRPDKLRVVFDCSASFRKHSLNKQLLSGPDLNNSLAGLLCRFRKERVAVTCDIKRMFHQFKVTKMDRKYLRFLWYGRDGKDIVDHQMNVHLFGAVSSPGCAIYGLQRIANDYSVEYPSAAAFVKENFYVDDGLVSVPTASEAINLMQSASDLMSKGNLVLHKFLSNDDEVARNLGCARPATKELSRDVNSNRALGLCWDVSQDVFKFTKVEVKGSTRRGILSTVASLFDPLGFLTPFTLKGKLILQSLCHDNKHWDDPLSLEQEREWHDWTAGMTNLDNLRINRCYIGICVQMPYDVELHVFSDASSEAYGVCSYLRLINRESNCTSVSLVMSKSRVAPKKVATIPRLELQAATLAVKVGGFLARELKYPRMTTHYWTDSEAVLGYISNDARRFHIFVCNRVERIRNTTNLDQWNHIKGSDNPADFASRGTNVKDIPVSWFCGPAFLQDASFSTTHALKRDYILSIDDPEIKKIFAHSTLVKTATDIITRLERCSSWNRVLRIMKYVLKFLSAFSQIKGDGYHEDNVCTIVMKLIQRQHYAEEIHLLQNMLRLPKTSPLYSLDPFLDEAGTLRVGGRLKNALCSYQIRHPTVLPANTVLTKVFIRQQHAQSAHQGRNTTMNAIRSIGVYLVGHGIKIVSSIIHNCVHCKRLRYNPDGQKMANLPVDRTEPAAPFTATGIDAFGPFYVKDRRKECKRYGMLFTCMASRAVHVEVLEDMTTDCFVNSLRNFLAIRGPVTVFYSDRGTNFVGAKNEFRRCLNEMLETDVKRFLESRQSRFSFNIPASSHMGGSWERMIRTIRSTLNGILTEQISTRLDTSSLRTLFYECMNIVNSRPLTTHQLSSGRVVDPLPLTPNQLLTMKEPTLLSPPGRFEEVDLYGRKRWRRVQYLAEQFWSRWKLEYLQSLQKRNKWTKIQRNLQPGDIVLLVENDQPRSQWRLCRVIDTTKSQDGLVRKAVIRRGNRENGALCTLLERPSQKLILMVPASTR